MNRLLRFREILPKVQFCGILFEKIKCTRITRIPRSRSLMTRTSENMELKLKSRDSIPEEFQIVYRGGIDTYVNWCHWTAITLMIVGTTSLYDALSKDPPLQFPIYTHITSVVGIQNYTQLFIMYASFFGMLISMRLLGLRYVVRMYYNDKTKTYKAVKSAKIPIFNDTVEFQAGTLKRITKKSMVPWWNVQYKTNGTKLLMFDHAFRTSADFDRMFVD